MKMNILYQTIEPRFLKLLLLSVSLLLVSACGGDGGDGGGGEKFTPTPATNISSTVSITATTSSATAISSSLSSIVNLNSSSTSNQAITNSNSSIFSTSLTSSMSTSTVTATSSLSTSSIVITLSSSSLSSAAVSSNNSSSSKVSPSSSSSSLASSSLNSSSSSTPKTFEKLWDEIAATADWGFAPFQTTDGMGGAFEDTSMLVPATNNSNVQTLKGFGKYMPSGPNLTVERTSLFNVEIADLWYIKEGEKGYGVYQDRGNWDRYIRIRNGAAMRYVTPNGQQISPRIDKAYHEIICFRPVPGSLNETLGSWRINNNKHAQFNRTDPTAESNTPLDYYKIQVWEFITDSVNNWQIFNNGTVVASGNNSFEAYSQFWIGSNGHPMAAQWIYSLIRIGGAFTTEERNLILNNTDAIWGLNSYPTYPTLDGIEILKSTQWSRGANGKFDWDLYRGKTVTFRGGNGIAGTHLYQWYYWDGANASQPFPANNKLDSHFAFPGADGQNSVLDRSHYAADNNRGNPVLFKNPGLAPYMLIFCVVTPRDSVGNEGEKIVVSFTTDNITPN